MSRASRDLHHLIQNSRQEQPAPKAGPEPWIVEGVLRVIPDSEWEAYSEEQRLEWGRLHGKQAYAEWSEGFRSPWTKVPGWRPDPWAAGNLP